MSELKSRITIALIRGIGALPLGISRGIGTFFGAAAYALNTRAARVTQKNLSICFPHLHDLERKRLTKQSLGETGKLAAEVCAVLTRPADKTLALIKDTEGEELVYEALNRGKGLLVLAPHLGNWEVLGMSLPHYAPTTNLYQPPKKTGLDPLLVQGRGGTGAVLAPTSAKGVAAL